MVEAKGVKAATDEERKALRTVLARTALLSGAEGTYTECPCGGFYIGARCPDKTCKEWLQVNGGKKVVKMYVHADDSDGYEKGGKLGLEGEALGNFAHWGGEIACDVEVDLRTGNTKIIAVDGHKVQY